MSDLLVGELAAKARHMIELAADQAIMSSCLRSLCGAVIVAADGTSVIGAGYNSPPQDCPIGPVCRKDTLPADFRSDKTCCLHAEQRAVFDALAHHADLLVGSTIYFVRLGDDGEPKPSGEPYCTICSKTTLDVGIATFVLWRPEGFRAYGTYEYNELSFGYRQTT